MLDEHFFRPSAAQRTPFRLQFLLESIVLTAVGGVIGIMLGAGISAVIHALSKLPTYVSMWSVITGLTFGLWPAVKAARLDPIEALRYE